MHVPRDLQERALAVSRQTERLSARLGRSPTVDELAEALACPAEEVIEALDAAHNYRPASLDASIAHEDDDHSALGDTLGAEDEGFELAEDRQMLAAGWASLTDVERQVLALRLLHDLTQREISERMGCSRCTCRGCCAGRWSGSTQRPSPGDLPNLHRRRTDRGWNSGACAPALWVVIG